MKLSTLILAAITASLVTSTTYADDAKGAEPEKNKQRSALFVATQGIDDLTHEHVLIFRKVPDAKKADEMLRNEAKPSHFTSETNLP